MAPLLSGSIPKGALDPVARDRYKCNRTGPTRGNKVEIVYLGYMGSVPGVACCNKREGFLLLNDMIHYESNRFACYSKLLQQREIA